MNDSKLAAFDPYEIHFADIDGDDGTVVALASLYESLLQAYESLLATVEREQGVREDAQAQLRTIDAVMALPLQWRHNAQGCGRRAAHAAGTWRSCARELEAVVGARLSTTQPETPAKMGVSEG